MTPTTPLNPMMLMTKKKFQTFNSFFEDDVKVKIRARPGTESKKNESNFRPYRKKQGIPMKSMNSIPIKETVVNSKLGLPNLRSISANSFTVILFQRFRLRCGLFFFNLREMVQLNHW